VLFYFSVWELGIAGSELALLSTLSPVLLSIPMLLDVASSHSGRTVLHCLSLVGLGAYALKSPVYRLFAVAFATSMTCIGWAVDWSARPANLGYQAMRTYNLHCHRTSLMLHLVSGVGLFMASVSKHANHSNNPGKSHKRGAVFSSSLKHLI
jgi:hypothetical protein